MNKISIIIPTLNEAQTIKSLLNYLREVSQEENISDIIVVDGGSADATISIVNNFNNIRLIHSGKGRAKQMNAGAKNTKGSVLYFLHADSLPPKNFDQLILNEIQQGHSAGCFRLKFDSNHWWLRLAGWWTQFNWKICRGGDQSLFIKADLFHDIGGYNEEYVIYEDNILIKELFRRKTHVVIKAPINTSARLYSKIGIWKLQFHFWVIHLKHSFGAAPHELLDYYQTHIAK